MPVAKGGVVRATQAPTTGNLFLIHMCEFILALTIVGVVETAPGWVTVDHMVEYPEGTRVETIYLHTDQYLECTTEAS